ncbi:putative peptidase [Luteimicrobium album]|uniref:Peptidase n=1 Tax=Luteimicrobium album TaxID=1054550 RepID=A0ABQ6I055_9MICO|nr:M24 family metallopeptidase [Luteimicrobium album]GMA24118.1 putative peptidase [Luteimicrobium album]
MTYPIIAPLLPPSDDFPMLSLAERDRRYGALRAGMSRDGLDALVVFGNGRDGYDRYISNEQLGTVAVLTATTATVIGRYPLARLDPSGDRYERWVDDVRQGPVPEVLRDLLAEHGLGKGATVGVVGLTGLGFGADDGWIAYTTWHRVLELLPAVRFVDAGGDFERMALVKSPEERAMVRKAAAIGEMACAAFVDATRPGVRETEVAAAALGATIAAGGWSYDPVVCFRAGRDRFSWGRPEWIGMGGGGRVLVAGDSAAAELFSFYGGFETQQQIEAHIGELDSIARALEATCHESYDAGLAVLARPGATFDELAEAMMAPMLRDGFWNTGPQVHGVGPCWPNTATHVNTQGDPMFDGLALPPVKPQDGDIELAPGMAFAFEPNAIRGHRRICIGGTVMLTEDGIEELNTLAKTVHVVPA